MFLDIVSYIVVFITSFILIPFLVGLFFSDIDENFCKVWGTGTFVLMAAVLMFACITFVLFCFSRVFGG